MKSSQARPRLPGDTWVTRTFAAAGVGMSFVLTMVISCVPSCIILTTYSVLGLRFFSVTEWSLGSAFVHRVSDPAYRGV